MDTLTAFTGPRSMTALFVFVGFECSLGPALQNREMRWTMPPERREIALVFLSLAAYFFAYNLESLGIDTAATKGTVFRHIGLGTTKDIGADGRKPPGWRDKLEDEIFGQWPWDQGYVVGHLREGGQPVGTGRHGASWIWRQKQEPLSEESFTDSVNNALERWGDDIPQTKVVKHAPGEVPSSLFSN